MKYILKIFDTIFYLDYLNQKFSFEDDERSISWAASQTSYFAMCLFFPIITFFSFLFYNDYKIISYSILGLGGGADLILSLKIDAFYMKRSKLILKKHKPITSKILKFIIGICFTIFCMIYAVTIIYLFDQAAILAQNL